MDRIRLMIVDDHPIVREGLGAMFASRGKFEIVASLDDGAEAVAWCRGHGIPDVILSDVRMAEMDGFETLRQLRGAFPDVRVILLAGLPNKAEEARARADGARGYMSKSANTTRLAEAVEKVAEGVVEFAADDYRGVKSPFTPKEQEVLEYLAQGKTREEIAVITGTAPDTVKQRTKAIREKMDAPNVAAAVVRACVLGYLRSPSAGV